MEGKAKGSRALGYTSGGGGSGGRLWHAYENAARQRQSAQFRHVSKGQSGIEGTSASVTHGARKEGWPTSIAGRDARECADSAMAHVCTKGAAGLLLLRKGNG